MNTLMGYDRLAIALHLGNPGLGRGARGRDAGKTHLFDTAKGRTACGRKQGRMPVVLVPQGVTDTNWQTRMVLCKRCQGK